MERFVYENFHEYSEEPGTTRHDDRGCKLQVSICPRNWAKAFYYLKRLAFLQKRFVGKLDEALAEELQLENENIEKLGKPDGFVFEEWGELYLVKNQEDNVRKRASPQGNIHKMDLSPRYF
jgi:hypothetical protein